MKPFGRKSLSQPAEFVSAASSTVSPTKMSAATGAFSASRRTCVSTLPICVSPAPAGNTGHDCGQRPWRWPQTAKRGRLTIAAEIDELHRQAAYSCSWPGTSSACSDGRYVPGRLAGSRSHRARRSSPRPGAAGFLADNPCRGGEESLRGRTGAEDGLEACRGQRHSSFLFLSQEFIPCQIFARMRGHRSVSSSVSYAAVLLAADITGVPNPDGARPGWCRLAAAPGRAAPGRGARAASGRAGSG